MAPLLLLAAVAADVPPPPPVVATTSLADRPLIAWIADTPRCDGLPVSAVTMRRPMTALGWTGTMPPAAPLILRFRIDSAGRPLSIVQVADQPGTYPNRPASQDVIPSLAASRFAVGEARSGCEITFRLRVTPLSETPVEDLISYTLAPESGKLPKPGWDRIVPAGATCGQEPRPQPLVQVLPDFRAMPATPGVRDWTMVRYDLDKRGRPVDVRTVFGTRNGVLDAEGLKAMKRSRFTEGPRTGCLYPYYRSPAKLPAPPITDPAPPAEGTCPADRGQWATAPRLIYPEPFRRRSIEGWAVVAFDVAPWGELGNFRELAAEPAAAFGEQAINILRQARRPASGTGASGCVERIRFQMGYRQGLVGDEPATD